MIVEDGCGCSHVEAGLFQLAENAAPDATHVPLILKAQGLAVGEKECVVGGTGQIVTARRVALAALGVAPDLRLRVQAVADLLGDGKLVEH